MSNVPVQLVVAAFQDEKRADDALIALRDAQRDGLIKIDDAAVLRKDEKDKLHIKETGDWGGGKGAVAGGLIGAAVGIIAGPIGVIGAGLTGALIGGLSAKLRDSGFDDNRLKKLGEGLQPGTSAIVAVVEHTWVDKVQKELDEYATDVFTEAISADIAQQLEEGHEVGISAIAAEGGTVIDRVAGDEEMTEFSELVSTDEGVVATKVVATEEGITGEQVVVTDEGISDVVFAADEDSAVIAGVAATDEGVVVGGALIEAEEEDDEGDEEEEE